MATLPWSRGLFVLCALAALLAAGCGPKRIVFQRDPLFPPTKNTELSILIVQPVDDFDLTPVRDALIRDLKDPTEALAQVRYVFGPALSALAHQHAKSTSVTSLVLADSSMSPGTSTWIHYELDQLSVPRFKIDDPAVSAALCGEIYDYIVVPQSLSFRSRVQGGQSGLFGPVFYSVPAYEELYLESAVAVIAPATNTIVWTGIVSSSQCEYRIGSTAVEEEVYDWLLDLLKAFGRSIRVPRPRL